MFYSLKLHEVATEEMFVTICPMCGEPVGSAWMDVESEPVEHFYCHKCGEFDV